MRPPAAQCRFVPPSVEGTEPGRVSGDFQSRFASPLAASAVQIAHGVGRGNSTGSGAPPVPGRRTKARRRPSGDQRGEPSREVEGAIQTMGAVSPV